MNNRLRRLALGVCLAATLSPVQAALTVSTTRVVFDSDKRNTSVVIANPSPYPFAVQTYINTAKDDTVTPVPLDPSGTCAVEIIDPTTGQPVSRIFMGNVNAAQFKQPDDEAANRAFGLRLTPGAGCILIPGASATVTFTGRYGSAGAAGTLYALAPDGSTGLALIIKDDLGTPISPTVASRPYPLHDTKPTSMLFSAAYKATSASVTAGNANADIDFSVDIP